MNDETLDKIIGKSMRVEYGNQGSEPMNGWYELHTPTLKQAIRGLIDKTKMELLEQLMTTNPTYTHAAAKDLLQELREQL